MRVVNLMEKLSLVCSGLYFNPILCAMSSVGKVTPNVTALMLF